MARFSASRKNFSITSYLPVLLLIIVLGVFVAFSGSFAKTNLSYEKDLLQKALERSITQCYALEGTYPSNLEYLEEHYGLTYNKDHFYVDYTYIGGNLRPDVTIIEKE